jgi:hypothetical protein
MLTITHLFPSNANFGGFFPDSAKGLVGLTGFFPAEGPGIVVRQL